MLTVSYEEPARPGLLDTPCTSCKPELINRVCCVYEPKSFTDFQPNVTGFYTVKQYIKRGDWTLPVEQAAIIL